MADHEYLSLCKVTEHPKDDINSLLRCADVMNGKIVPIITTGEKFADSKTILTNDDSQDIDTYGIWIWSVGPNQKYPDRPYFHAKYYCSPIEVLYFPGFLTLEELIKHFEKNYLNRQMVCDRIIFCTPCSKRGYRFDGILCSKSDLEINMSGIRINDTVAFLPRCQFNMEDIYTPPSVSSIPNKEIRNFYKELDIKTTQYVPIKNPMEIIKRIIHDRVVWKVAKNLGITHNNWQKIVQFLNDVNTNSIYDEISEQCHCSLDESKRYVGQFVLNASRYIDHHSIDDEILSNIVDNYPALTVKIEEQVQTQWEMKNQERIQTASEEYSQIMDDLTQKKSVLSETEKRTKDLEDKYEYFMQQIAEKEKLEQSIEEKINSKMVEAQKDVSNLLASFPFITFPNQKANVITETVLSPRKAEAYQSGDLLSSDQLFYYDRVEDLIGLLVEELDEAAVTEKFKKGLAVFLYSAFLNNMPVFLCGPNGEAIANAFSASLFGRLSGKLDCSLGYDPVFLDNMLSSDDHVIIIKGIFNGGWLQHLPDIISHKEKFFFIIHPYTEDLLIEPQSLFNYAIPIFTETFVEEIPNGAFLGGASSEKFERPTIANRLPVYDKTLKKIGTNLFFRNQMQSIISVYDSLNKDPNDDMKCLLALLPYAFIAGSGEKLIEEIDGKISSDMKKVCISFLRLDEDE